MGFNREVKYFCGKEYMEVDLFAVADNKKRGKRGKKVNKSLKKQIALNLKNSRRYFYMKLNSNFGEGDYCVHLTYASRCRPKTLEEAKRHVDNFIRALNRELKKQELPNLKYMGSTENGTNPDGSPKNIHHHIVMDGRLPREFIEDKWRARRRKGEKKGRRYGYVNVDRLQVDEEYGLMALGYYMTKQKGAVNQHKWFCSKGLKEPVIRKNDYRFSHRKVENLSGMTDCPEVWEKLYPGYLFTDAVATYSDAAGWRITVKMRRDIRITLKRKEKTHGKRVSRSNSRPRCRTRDAEREGTKAGV